MATTQDDRIADLQRAIAELRQERDTARVDRDTALAQRSTEFDERIGHQAATIDVLKAMSASPGDAQPVFELIVERARDLCDAYGVTVYEFDGSLIHLRAWTGVSDDPKVRDAFVALFPRAPTRELSSGRAILDRQIIRNDDPQSEPWTIGAMIGVTGAYVSVPMMLGDAVIGVVQMGRRERGGFSDTQIELLKTFAEQAVIAINSAETYRALQTRTSDLQESLEYQTATSDVLKVISRSTFDLQPVLEKLLSIAIRLCNADDANLSQREADGLRVLATRSALAEWAAALEGRLLPEDRSSVTGRAVLARRPVQIADAAEDADYTLSGAVAVGHSRTCLGVPLLRDGVVIGAIGLARRRVEPFTDRQIELVTTFADQAVIAMENTRLLTEQREALEQQTATAEVLAVINAFPGNLQPVFETILDKAHSLCGADLGALMTFDGEYFRAAAIHGFPEQHVEIVRQPFRPNSDHRKLVLGERLIHIPDVRMIEIEPDDEVKHSTAERTDVRSLLAVPLRKDGTLLGFISACRLEVRPFADREIALLENFAAHAVIAMENARLIAEQREALEQQTATAAVLRVINTNPGNLAPVFATILEKAHATCGAEMGSLQVWDGTHVRALATLGYPGEVDAMLRRPFLPGPAQLGILAGDRLSHRTDATLGHKADNIGEGFWGRSGIRTNLQVPLRKDGDVVGFITANRHEVRPFSEKEISLLENFSAQAVIAMENARLLDEIRQRQEELRVTFENMGDGVAMFDGTQHLVAWNGKFQDILDLPDDLIARRQTFTEYVRYLAERGEYGAGPGAEEQVRHLTEQAGQYRAYERTRPDGRVIEIRHNPVPSGGFVLILSDITERKRNEAEIRAARDAAEEASRAIEAAYRDLKAAQANLIQAEKMASLGQLTAGIAHEIKNPLNFVNNFAALSVDLLSELKETAAPGFAALTNDQRAEIEDVSAMLTSNLEKITEHGKRADGIVKAMLEHSRGSSAERRMVDLNALIDEALNLAYHGARAQDQSFNITLERDFGEGIAAIEVNPQDMTRVFLNIFSNGFYAATRRARNGGDAAFVPTLKVTTRAAGDAVEIRVRDNGTGIPFEIRDKLFQPFFTTKQTGEGTGLGLSITYDIVTKQHGGTITVDSELNSFAEFKITLPRQMFTNGGGRA